MAAEHYLGGGWRRKFETEYNSISLPPHPKQDKSAQGRVWDNRVQWESGEIWLCEQTIVGLELLWFIVIFKYFCFCYWFKDCSGIFLKAFFRPKYQKQRAQMLKYDVHYTMIAKRIALLLGCDPQPWRSREWPHKYRIRILNDLW